MIRTNIGTLAWISTHDRMLSTATQKNARFQFRQQGTNLTQRSLAGPLECDSDPVQAANGVIQCSIPRTQRLVLRRLAPGHSRQFAAKPNTRQCGRFPHERKGV